MCALPRAHQNQAMRGKQVVSQVDQGTGGVVKRFTPETRPDGKTNLARFSSGKPYGLDN